MLACVFKFAFLPIGSIFEFKQQKKGCSQISTWFLAEEGCCWERETQTLSFASIWNSWSAFCCCPIKFFTFWRRLVWRKNNLNLALTQKTTVFVLCFFVFDSLKLRPTLFYSLKLWLTEYSGHKYVKHLVGCCCCCNPWCCLTGC